MARRAIILDALGDGIGRQTELRVCLWADVPAARQRFYANALAKSAFLDATAAELLDLQNGVVAETIQVVRVDPGSAAATILAAIAQVQSDWQTAITNRNIWARYGSSYDPTQPVGSRWTIASVA